MKHNTKKYLIFSIGVVVLIAVVFGATYAYLNTLVTNNNITGKSYDIDATLTLTPVKTGNLIPVSDDLITTSLNGGYPCEDARDNYNLCSIYIVTLTNSDAAINFNGYIQTNSETTYTSNNLKYQLFTHSTTYTSVSSADSIDITTDSKNYFKLNNNIINFSVASGKSNPVDMEYYLVIWLSDSNNNQLLDVNDTYVGSLVFETLNGGRVQATFDS